MRPSHFTGPIHHNMAKLALKFWTAYQTVIMPHAFALSLKDVVKTGKVKAADAEFYTAKVKELHKTDIDDRQSVLERLIRFILVQELRRIIHDIVAKKLVREDFDGIRGDLQSFLVIQAISYVVPVDHRDDTYIDARTKARDGSMFAKAIGISTGIKKLDDILIKKGWYKKELYLVRGKAKFDKTISMLWCDNAATRQGVNVAYYMLETSPKSWATAWTPWTRTSKPATCLDGARTWPSNSSPRSLMADSFSSSIRPISSRVARPSANFAR